ncbi:hypothetical protein IG631_23622 [Alternaria alternata]|nr:hypothetical protein IG631_23622 [Alternaria alternata]
MPLSEMNLASIQTNPHHTHLWTCSVCALVLRVFLCRLAPCDDQNTVVVVATTAMSHALRSEPLWFSPPLDHCQPHVPQSATAMAMDVTEVHIVPDLQDA